MGGTERGESWCDHNWLPKISSEERGEENWTVAQSAEPLELSPFSLFWGQDGLRQQTGVCLRKVWLPLAEVLGGLRVKPEGSHAGTLTQ